MDHEEKLKMMMDIEKKYEGPKLTDWSGRELSKEEVQKIVKENEKIQQRNEEYFKKHKDDPFFKDFLSSKSSNMSRFTVTELTESYIRKLLPQRDPEGHKGTFGKVYCLCGAVGYTGAPVLAATAAVRSGSGLVYLGVPENIWPITAVKCQSAMPFPLPSQQGKLALAAEETIRERIAGCDAVLIGCGLGRSGESDALTRKLLDVEKPLVLDADGINAFEERIYEMKRRQGLVTVMTPHEGEFFRAGGDLSRGRESGARAYAARWGVYLILKGHRTVVAAPDGRLAVNTTGNSGMAKGGSGDILSGMVVSLLGQGMEPFDACCAAVFCHGLAGDRAAARLGERGMSPADLLAELPHAFQEIEQG